MRESPYRILEEALRPHLGARAQVVLEEGLKRLGKRPEELSEKDAETLLKGLIFRELQARLPAAQARRAVEEALARLAPAPEGGLEALERGLARFGLYVDWPEVGRLRALVNRLRREPDPRLLQEGLALLDHLEEKLEEALLRQAQDLAHLEEALERVRPLGGPKVRRLESLIQIVREAHREGTLAQGEVERARALALELRKYLASSAVQPATLPEMVFETQEEDVLVTVEEAPALEEELVIDLESLAEPQAQEIRALEVAEEKRRLEELVLRYAPFLDHPRAAALRAEVEALLEADQPALEKLTELEAALKEAEAEAKAARRARLIQLEEALRRLPLPQEAKAPLEEEARRLKEEKARLLEELSALGEAAKPLAEELAHLEGEALAQALPGIRARYAELLKGAGEEARRARLEERKAALRALKEEAEALGLGEEVAEAERALAQGELPDLEALRRRLEEAQALRRRLALEELARLQALAERFRPLGGEAVLKAIEAERQKPLPDPAPIARALQAMKRRLEAKRQELGTRLAAFFRRYAPLEGLKSDTQRRIRPLVEFLRPAQKALDRLGPRGVLEVERALAQAEEALKELEKEKEAADRLLKELGQEDLEALLSSLEAPGGERPDLSPLRLPGVKALGLLDDPLPLPRPQLKALHQALKALEAATGEALGPALVRLGGSYLVLAPWRGHEAVALVEPEALDPFLKALSG
ncbi:MULTISPECIES: hypothetical protein [Thermus]|uniref:hypothetical protein n=1 Tax=Thermus TaxID=270 RepID=UPI000ED0F482|nr:MULTISPECIES: hypothetical protein [Thermus]QZY58291.1 hypothetical protein K7H19_08680 [Thermus thermophilus]HAH40115.1 hypothetical protein [Thermus sp.]